MGKIFRVDYTVPEVDDKRLLHIFMQADNLTLAKHIVNNMPYFGWQVKKIEQDTEANYEKWVNWKYEPNYPEKK